MTRIRACCLLALLLPLSSCADAKGWITVHNQIDVPITALSIDPCGAAAPGPDRLSGGQVPASGSESFQVRYGCHQVTALAPDGRFAEWIVEVNGSNHAVSLFMVAN